jgi:hypothetical protein
VLLLNGWIHDTLLLIWLGPLCGVVILVSPCDLIEFGH